MQAEECGVATGGDSNHLYDSTKSWNGQYDSSGSLYSCVMIVDGPGAGEIRRISSSQGQTITLAESWSTTPTTRSRYVIAKGWKTWGWRWHDPGTDDGYYYGQGQAAYACTVVKRFLEQYRAEQTTCQSKIDLTCTLLCTKLGLDDGDFLRVPVLYRCTVDGEESWLPNMVNLLNVGGLIIPEPFISGTDTEFNEKFKKVLSGTYIDDWYFYHTGRGEVHCGTNVKRDPANLASWWNN